MASITKNKIDKKAAAKEVEPKFHRIASPDYDFHTDWNENNFEFDIAFTATKTTEHFNKAYKEGELLILTLGETDLLCFYNEIRSALIKKAKMNLDTLVAQDRAYWRADSNMTDEEYDEREKRIYDQRGNRK